MATIKISALPGASSIDGVNDVLAIVQSGVTNKITRNTLLGITGNPIGDTDNQTLTNKTIGNTNTITQKGTQFTLQDDTSATKQARFVMSTITAGQTRSFTLPDRTDTIVTLGGTQTLTAKTLTAPTITGPSVTGTVSGSATYSTPTLTTPTIADFTNATHNHSNAAGGGATLTSPTINTPVVSSPTMRGWDGWQDANEAWTFNSATAITVPSDATTKYSVGDKIKLTQSATVKHFYIVAVAATVLTITGGSDFTLTNVAISANFYSKMSSPLSFPQWFNFAATYTGFTATIPTSGVHRFSIVGRTVYYNVRPNTAGTSNAITFTVSLPVAAASIANANWDGWIKVEDNGTFPSAPGEYVVTSLGTTASILKDQNATAFTNSGSKMAQGVITYEI